MVRLLSRLAALRIGAKAAAKVANRAANTALDRAEKRRHPHRNRNITAVVAIPSAVLGAAAALIANRGMKAKPNSATISNIQDRAKDAASRVSEKANETVNKVTGKANETIDLTAEKATTHSHN